MDEWKQDLTDSAKRFDELIRPELKRIFRGDFYTIESVTNDEITKLLDVLAGIDAWHISTVKGIRGLASRIQVGDKDWRTFTIRDKRSSGTKTEYEKRKYAIENNYLYPYLTMQAYITKDNKIISFAVARTVDIIEMIDKGMAYIDHTKKEQKGQASFHVIKWEDVKNAGYKIIIYP